MIKRLKNTVIGLSIVAAIAIAPSSLQAGAMEGLTESTSAGLESPNFEKQLVRINTGINFVRLGSDVMESMPISEDSEWVDKVVANMDADMVRETMNLKEVKTDAYFSTVTLTNGILGRLDVPMSPAMIRLYYVASVIYKNESNLYKKDANNQFELDEKGNKIPLFFKKDDKGEFILDKAGKKIADIDYIIPDMNEFPDVTD